MRITVISPHRDDAAFSLGLTIDTWSSLGHHVQVVNCFTKSKHSPVGDLTTVSADDLQSHVTFTRRREDLRWSSMYREEVEILDLSLLDAPERRECGVHEVCVLPVDLNDSAIAKIRTSIHSCVTDALVLPLAIGDHVDHLTARAAAQQAWPSLRPMAFYEDLPYAARPGAADGIESRAAEVAAALGPAFANDAINVDAAVQRKRRLALCYASQIGSDVAEQIASFCMRYGGRERLWANQPWREAYAAVQR